MSSFWRNGLLAIDHFSVTRNRMFFVNIKEHLAIMFRSFCFSSVLGRVFPHHDWRFQSNPLRRAINLQTAVESADFTDSHIGRGLERRPPRRQECLQGPTGTSALPQSTSFSSSEDSFFSGINAIAHGLRTGFVEVKK